MIPPAEPGIRRIDPDAEATRLAEQRQQPQPVVLYCGDPVQVTGKDGVTYTGRVAAVNPQNIGEGRIGFTLICAPLDEQDAAR